MRDGLFGSLVKRALGFEERYFGKAHRVEAARFIAAYLEFYTQQEALFVAGELAPAFYESAEFKDAARAILQRAGSESIRIICGKSADLIKEENPFLYELARRHLVSIYIAAQRPKFHYICIDGSSLLLEGLHNKGQSCETYFMENAKDIARRYRDKFYYFITESNQVKRLVATGD